jgi:cell division protein FtsB
LKLRLGVGLLLLAGAVYFAVFGGDYDSFDLRRIRSERGAEEQRVQEARADVERLRARRDSLRHDNGAIERIARERYGLIRDGERLYRFADSPADLESAAPGQQGGPDDAEQGTPRREGGPGPARPGTAGTPPVVPPRD